VIWIAASVYLIGPKTYSFLWRGPILDVETATGRHFLLDSSKNRQELIGDITVAAKQEIDRNELLEFVESKIGEATESARRAW
jgi:hypothetical protein